MWSGKKLLALGAALALLLGGCGADPVQAGPTILADAGTEQKSYEIYEAVPGDIVKSSSLGLDIAYTQRQALYAPDDGLYLDEVLVERGQFVKEGEAIAVFHRDSSEAELKRAELALRRAEEDWEEQEEDLETALENAGMTGYLQWELAQLEYDRASYLFQRRSKELQKAAEEAREAFSPVELIAPFDCVIDTVTFFYHGQQVDSHTAVAEVSRAASMVLVGETAASHFQYGSEVQLEYGRSGSRKTAPARVVSTSALVGKSPQKIWILPDEPIDPAELEKPVATLTSVQLKDALTVPLSAVKTENGSSYVQVLIDGVPHKRYIIRGVNVGSTGENHVVVLSGLEAGQQVILN